MPTTRELKIISRALFFSVIFFITVFFADWFWGPFFFNKDYRVLKYALCVICPALTVCFNFYQEKSLNFTGKSCAVIMSCFLLGGGLFNLLKIPQFSVSEMSSLYHISYALVCLFSVFIFSTVIAAYVEKSDYALFYNDFFLGYTPVMIVLYVLLYFVYREYGMSYSVNLVPFKGEIAFVLTDLKPLTLMRTAGNIAFYSTVSLTAARFAKKHCTFLCFFVPFVLSVATELVQGVFSIGDADIDDIILNSAGALISTLIYKFIIDKLRRKTICSD